jgi:hypothetical protein
MAGKLRVMNKPTPLPHASPNRDQIPDHMGQLVSKAITQPERLWSREEVLSRPCPVPPTPGVYGWYFRDLPCNADTAGCIVVDGLTLLYIGISPSEPPKTRRAPSTQNLRKRIRTHFRGNASGSTLRLTLGTLLDLKLRDSGSGRLTFGEDEGRLNDFLAANARVCWVPTPEPWIAEERLIRALDLPLNLDGNSRHPFHNELSRLRKDARRAARGDTRASWS